MLLGDLLDLPVEDTTGRRLGFVVDVRLVLDGPPDGVLAAPRMHGLLVSPRTGTSFLGYERTGERAPALVARWLRWRHRGTFLVLRDDVVDLDPSRDGDHPPRVVTVRAGCPHWDPALRVR